MMDGCTTSAVLQIECSASFQAKDAVIKKSRFSGFCRGMRAEKVQPNISGLPNLSERASDNPRYYLKYVDSSQAL